MTQKQPNSKSQTNQPNLAYNEVFRLLRKSELPVWQVVIAIK
jgi:hypothetical protein